MKLDQPDNPSGRPAKYVMYFWTLNWFLRLQLAKTFGKITCRCFEFQVSGRPCRWRDYQIHRLCHSNPFCYNTIKHEKVSVPRKNGLGSCANRQGSMALPLPGATAELFVCVVRSSNLTSMKGVPQQREIGRNMSSSSSSISNLSGNPPGRISMSISVCVSVCVCVCVCVCSYSVALRPGTALKHLNSYYGKHTVS